MLFREQTTLRGKTKRRRFELKLKGRYGSQITLLIQGNPSFFLKIYDPKCLGIQNKINKNKQIN